MCDSLADKVCVGGRGPSCVDGAKVRVLDCLQQPTDAKCIRQTCGLGWVGMGCRSVDTWKRILLTINASNCWGVQHNRSRSKTVSHEGNCVYIFNTIQKMWGNALCHSPWTPALVGGSRPARRYNAHRVSLNSVSTRARPLHGSILLVLKTTLLPRTCGATGQLSSGGWGACG